MKFAVNKLPGGGALKNFANFVIRMKFEVKNLWFMVFDTTICNHKHEAGNYKQFTSNL